MKPVNEKDLKMLKEIQGNNEIILEQQKKINALIEQIIGDTE